MPRRLPAPDYAAVLAVLPPHQRAVIAEWEEGLGLPAGGWSAVPGLRDVVLMVAALRLVSEMLDLSGSDALSEALAALGVEDDSERGARPSDSLDRKLRKWVSAAHAVPEQEVRSRAREKCFLETGPLQRRTG